MVPQRILGSSALLASAVIFATLVHEARTMPSDQIQGVLLAGVMAFSCAVLVLRSATFAAAARWYIAWLMVGLLGAVAASAAHEQGGDVLGLCAAVAGALGCAAALVRDVARMRGEDDAVISPAARQRICRLVERLEAEVAQWAGARGDASERTRPALAARADQLRAQLRFAAGWSDRLRLPGTDPIRRRLTRVEARLLGRSA